MLSPHLPTKLYARPFGSMPDGRVVEAYTLTGKNGLCLEVLTYGGIVNRLRVQDHAGALADVVLGYDDFESYLKDPCFMGATVGRIAGRVSAGKLQVEGKEYKLPINDAPNHLHGGPAALNTTLWTAEPITREDGAPALKLSYTSPDGEQGYPGELRVSVIYTVTDANEFIYETYAESDQITPASLTHHSYFNLSGQGTVMEHAVQIHSSHTIQSDEKMTLLHELESVEGRAADLREPRKVAQFIADIWQQHGDLYWLGESSEMKPVARVVDPASGRILEAHTTQSCVQTYFGESYDGSIIGKSGAAYPQFPGFCLECQGYPEATNVAGFGNILIYPGKPLHHRTIYAFSNQSQKSPKPQKPNS